VAHAWRLAGVDRREHLRQADRRAVAAAFAAESTTRKATLLHATDSLSVPKNNHELQLLE
jgi:hypothetical protein